MLFCHSPEKSQKNNEFFEQSFNVRVKSFQKKQEPSYGICNIPRTALGIIRLCSPVCRLSGLLDNDCACNCERSDERESDEAAVGSRLGSAALGFVSGLGFLCGSGGVVIDDIAA